MIADDCNTPKSPLDEPAPSPLMASEKGDSSLKNKRALPDFSTGHLLTNLKTRTISSGGVTVFSQGIQFVLTLASVAVLARLLAPKDFGLVAMVTTITGFFRIFNDAGLSTATVQREGITHAQVSNLFWANIALGGSMSLILAACAPLVAWFYREPRLLAVTLVVCVTFLLNSSTVQHLALIKRQMRFKMIALIEIASMSCGIVVAIGMAWMKCGYWSLVGMQLGTPMTSFLLTWSASRWRPQLPSRRSGTRPMLHFGAHLTISTFIWSLSRGSDALLIGRFCGSTSLGLYSRASALLCRPVEQLISPISAVFVPVLSRLQPHPERYRRVFLQTYDVVALTGFFFSGLILALAEPTTLVVLGPKWEKAAPILAGFTLLSLYVPLASTAGWLLTSQGRGRDFLLQSLIGSILTIACFLLALPYGPVGMAISYSVLCLFVILPVVYYITGREGPVTTRDLWGRFFRQFPLWPVVCGSALLTRKLLGDASPFAQLLICGPVGVLAGAAFIFIYFPSRHAVASLFDAMRHWKSSRGGKPSQ